MADSKITTKVEYKADSAVPNTKEYTTIESILKERGTTHGDFANHAWTTQSMKGAFRAGLERAGNNHLTPSMLESVDMILHKLGRVAAGNPKHKDHWDDIAGYATLVSKELS